MPRDYLQRIDTRGRGRYDVTPLFADERAFSTLLDDFATLLQGVSFDVIAGIDALGFILGAALATRHHKGFVPVRKGGKLPVPAHTAEFVDYSGTHKVLELRRDAIAPGTHVLVVDEWIETGAQASAAIRLIEGQDGTVAGIVTIHIDENDQTRRLLYQYRCMQVWPDA